jgi:DNA-binding transcriptional regulator GbsR (MarR family)
MTMTHPSHPAVLLAADAVGDVIEYWGFRKALGRVWAVLYLWDGPLSAGDIGERLQMSAGAVSMALTELQRWAVVKRVWLPGERREFFEAEVDLWKMIAKVISERERYLARGVRERLEQAKRMVEESGGGVKGQREKLEKLVSVAQLAEHVIEAFIQSRTADFSTFTGALSGAGEGPAKARKARLETWRKR